jgi:hypothetical protein
MYCSDEQPCGTSRRREPKLASLENLEHTMKPFSLNPRVVAALLAWMLVAPAALADPRALEAFDSRSWSELQQTAVRPAVVIFTTTDCAHCPAVIQDAVSHKQQKPGKPALAVIVVVMDAEPSEVQLMKDTHYRKVDRLMAFDEAAARLRFSVDPHWIGVTPYVGMLGKKPEARFVMGSPSRDDWKQLLE